MDLVLQLVVAGVVMGVLDFVWLGYVGKKLYYNEIGKLLRKKPNMGAAILFYVVYVCAVVLFAVSPALAADSLSHAALYGLGFGVAAYATYDLTSLSVMEGFSKKIAAIDIIWGAALTTTVSVLTYLIVHAWV